MDDQTRDLRWPPLPLAEWQDTYITLHMWTQVIGKLVLAMTPLTNHYWNLAFHFTACGLASQPMRTPDGRTLTAMFDFVGHRLLLECSDGAVHVLDLGPRTVADFHAEVMSALMGMGIEVRIRTMPFAVPDPIPFEQDTTHRSYDAAQVSAFWRALRSIGLVLEDFRAGFVGKCSPVHFFWDAFDLAVTRFSGRRAPEQPNANPVMRESYSHEVISHGFWPGGGGLPEAAFYAYAAPEPEGFKQARVAPAGARYDTTLNEFILPYEAVRTAASPEEALMRFLQTTYEAGAVLGKWDRSVLER